MTSRAAVLPLREPIDTATAEETRSSGIAADPASDEAVAEAFRTLRTQLLLRARSGQRTFTVCSARPGEGKSTVAVNLAAALARTQRTLLVDGDLRRPSLHRVLGVPNRFGFAEMLTETLPLAVATQRLSSRLSLVTSGRCGGDPQALLLGPGLVAATGAMSAEYDVVLFDSAPVLAVTDTCLLASRTDGVIVVVRDGLPTRADIRLMRERLTAVGASIVGSVLNRVDGRAARGYHPYPYETETP